MENYSVTIGYSAVIEVQLKADSEEEAKQAALELFKKQFRDKAFKGKIILGDDTYGAYGVTNMDKTWNQL